MNYSMFALIAVLVVLAAACSDDSAMVGPDAAEYHDIDEVVSSLVAGKRGGAKVSVCHFPPGNPDNFQVITVGAKAAEKHVAEHGDGIVGDAYPFYDAETCTQIPEPDSGCPCFKTDAFNQSWDLYASPVLFDYEDGVAIGAAGVIDVLNICFVDTDLAAPGADELVTITPDETGACVAVLDEVGAGL